MLAALLHLVNNALSWLERTPWGAPLISAAIGGVLGVLSWIADQPLVITIVLVSLGIQAWFYILRWGLPILGRKLAPNLIIEIPEGIEGPNHNGSRSVCFTIRIVNASVGRRVSLHFVYLEDATGLPRYRFYTRDIEHDLVTNLAPEEETSGQMRVEHSEHSKQASAGEHTKKLIVGDRLTNRMITVAIPGQFRR
jgi:hypothetical protein